MMLLSLLAVGGHLLLVSDRVPVLNVAPVCEGIARQGGTSFRDPQIAKERAACIKSELQVRAALVKAWPAFAAADKHSCIAEATTGGDASYTELLTCLQMARDVRNLKKEPSEASVEGRRRR